MSNLSDFLTLEKNSSKREIEVNYHFETTEQVQKYVENLVLNPDSKDPFWDDMAKSLLLSTIYLQLATMPEEKQNLYTCAEIINESIDTIEEEDCHLSVMIKLLPFDHIAVMHYKPISIMPPKTFRSVFMHTKEILSKVLEITDRDDHNQSQSN